MVIARVFLRVDIAVMLDEPVLFQRAQRVPVHISTLLDNARERDCDNYSTQVVRFGVMQGKSQRCIGFSAASRNVKREKTGLACRGGKTVDQNVGANAVHRRKLSCLLFLAHERIESVAHVG